jgi:hypothetical protein
LSVTGQFGSLVWGQLAACACGVAALSAGRAPRAGTTPKITPGAGSPDPDAAGRAGAGVAALAAADPAIAPAAPAAVAAATAPIASQPRMFNFVPLCSYFS